MMERREKGQENICCPGKKKEANVSGGETIVIRCIPRNVHRRSVNAEERVALDEGYEMSRRVKIEKARTWQHPGGYAIKGKTWELSRPDSK